MVHYALMANWQKIPELEEPHAAIKSAVWEISREQMVDLIESLRCLTVECEWKYVEHVKVRQHHSVSTTWAKKKQQQKQQQLHLVFSKQPLDERTDRANDIPEVISTYMMFTVVSH